MRKRPEIRQGDLVKLTKNAVAIRVALGHQCNPKDSFVVTGLDGNGSEAMTMVTCRGLSEEGVPFYVEFYRKELWYSGHNIFEPKKTKIRLLQSRPKNNDGRETCFVCNQPTRVTGGGMYNVCANTECEWYDN